MALAGILRRQAEAWGWQPALFGAAVAAVWREALGETLSRHTRLWGLRERTVVVAVPASTWAQELTYWKGEILQRLNARVAETVGPIEDLKVRVEPRAFRRAPVGMGEGRERGGGGLPTARAQSAVEALDRAARSHLAASREWFRLDYHPCQRCHSPTLRPYVLCATCTYRENF